MGLVVVAPTVLAEEGVLPLVLVVLVQPGKVMPEGVVMARLGHQTCPAVEEAEAEVLEQPVLAPE
jgi:hypothetical protein